VATIEVVLLLVLGVAVLSPLADRVGVPPAIAIVAFGFALAVLPAAPTLRIEPELVLPLVLPPLLFNAAWRSTTHELRRDGFAIGGLAVGLVLVTTVAVTAVAVWVDPTLGIAGGVILGAIVSPPDPVSASAVAGRLGLPRRVIVVLEGEGMLNDATALVLYRIALVAAVTGAVSLVDAAVTFALSTVGAVAAGLLVGLVARWLLDRLDDGRAQVLVTVLAPYAAFLSIDLAGGSGVVAVITVGLYLGQYASASLTSIGRLGGEAVWNVLDFALGGLVFGLIGFEVVEVFQSQDIDARGLTVAAAITGTALVIRALWIAPMGPLLRRAGALDQANPVASRRLSLVLSWAGMRGVVSLAVALSLPTELPGRPVILVSAAVLVLVTLVGQGLTLPWLIRLLGVGGNVEDDTAQVRTRAAAAALAALDGLEVEGEVDPPLADQLRHAYELRDPVRRRVGDSEVDDVRRRAEVVRLLLAAERAEVLSLRRNGEATAEAIHRVLADIETRAVRAERTINGHH